MHRWRWREPSVLPGFGPALGCTLLYLGLVVLLPLSMLVVRSTDLGWQGLLDTVTTPRVLTSFRLTFGTALIAAAINTVCGLLVAWFLVRVELPGKRIVDALIDLPFALPTAVSGIALTTVYAPHGWLGKPLQALGLKVAFAPTGIVVAMVFIGLPFVIRTVQPALAELEPELEEAAIALAMLAGSFTLLLAINLLQSWSARRLTAR